MKRPLILVLAALLAILSACGDDDDGGANASDDGVRHYTVGYTSSPGLGDLFTYMTWDDLRTQGIDIRPRFFAGDDVMIQSLLNGEIDLTTNMATDSVLFAVNGGQPLKIIAGYTGPEFLLAGPVDVTEASALVGKRVGVHGATGGDGGWLKAYLEANGVDPEDVDIVGLPGSEVRAQALLAGELDFTTQAQDSLLFLEKEAPGKYHSIEEFGIGYGGKGGVATATTEDFISEHGDDVQAIVTQMIETTRAMYADPGPALQQAPVYYGAAYPDPEFLAEAIGVYLEKKLYPDDGGLSDETVNDYLEFTKTHHPDFQGVEIGPVEDYYDRSFVQKALEELDG